MVDLSSLIRTGGRAAKTVAASFVREIEEKDLAELIVEKGSRTPELVKIRDRHHTLARLLAEGLCNEDVSAITGYSPSRVSILKNDPAIENLVAFYRNRVTDRFIDHVGRVTAVRDHALELLDEKLEKEGTDLPAKELREIFRDLADRSGLGPAPKTTTVNVNVGIAQRMEAARQRVISQPATPPGGQLSITGTPYEVLE